MRAAARRRPGVAAGSWGPLRRAVAAAAAPGPRTLFDKIWEDHLVDEQPDGTALLYIDRHLVHEVTSPQAFEGLRTAGRVVRRPGCTLATADHNVPTSDRSAFTSVSTFIKEAESRTQACPRTSALRRAPCRRSSPHSTPPHPAAAQPALPAGAHPPPTQRRPAPTSCARPRRCLAVARWRRWRRT